MKALQRTAIRLSSTAKSTCSSDAAAAVTNSKQARSFTTADDSIPPNRMTSAYNEMKKVCPDAIRLYATCVMNHSQLGSLEKDCCKMEFSQVKECFRSVRLK
jgi:hypothetical protein